MKNLPLSLPLILLTTAPTAALSMTIHVPDDSRTNQGAVDAARNRENTGGWHGGRTCGGESASLIAGNVIAGVSRSRSGFSPVCASREGEQ
jgi:hypothetical protein